MTASGYDALIRASMADRRLLFREAASQLATTRANIEKDFWVCWTLDQMYHELRPGSPRLLFKGGTSLSKAYGLIQRFSEDIDVTVFGSDLGLTPAHPSYAKPRSGDQHC